MFSFDKSTQFITKPKSSQIRYLDNKVYISIKNGDMVVFKRAFCKLSTPIKISVPKSRSFTLQIVFFPLKAFWNYDSYITKSLGQISFNAMVAVAGKLWCTDSNKVIVLNPSSLTPEVSHSIIHLKSSRINI